MKKRLFSLILALMTITSLSGPASAVELAPYSNSSIDYATATASTGSNSGEIKIIFDVSATGTASTIGISTIRVYASNGYLVRTLSGSTQNGLLKSNAHRYNSTYIYSGASGTSYYAEITFTATVNGVKDSLTVTTNTAKAA